MTPNSIVCAGMIGMVASILVGIGEGLLHGAVHGVTPDQPYAFMIHLSAKRQMLGHFLAVLAGPLYLFGYWHVYQMLAPDGGLVAKIVTMAAGYGFFIGIVWIGSRAMIGSIAQMQAGLDPPIAQMMNALIPRYQLLMETLLQVIRITTLLFSIGFVYLILRGETLYPVWMVLFNPFVLLLLVFLIYFVMPSVGKYIMPIAMNVAHLVFFSASVIVAILRSSF